MKFYNNKLISVKKKFNLLVVLLISTIGFTQNYCETKNIKSNDEYFIFNVKLKEINNFSYKNAAEYTFYNNVKTDLVRGKTYDFSINGVVELKKDYYLKVFIDFNNDGAFEEKDELVFEDKGKEKTYNFFNRSFNFTVPETSKLGETRVRVILKEKHKIDDPCDLKNKKGEVEDYLINIIDDQVNFEKLIFTQIYHSNTDKWIEVTNTGNATIAANTVNIHLFKNKSGDQSNITPDASYTIPYEIPIGSSFLVRNSTASLVNYIGSPVEDDLITDFDAKNDFLIISSSNGPEAWENRYDLVAEIANNSSKVRLDNVVSFNNSYDTNEWIEFVDDNLDPYRDLVSGGPERHPHDPLISEVNNADNNSNILLGLHFVGSTERKGGDWSNGNPDKSRVVVIKEDYSTIYRIQANSLVLETGVKLTVKNELVLIVNALDLNDGAELRLAEESQLIQMHTNAKNVAGNGKIFLDQKSNNESIYNYTYLGSPVVSTGENTYFIADVLKDGTSETSENSVPLDIQFVDGYDGAATSPISIAMYWLYTYANGDGGLSSWEHTGPYNEISPTDGFTIKGPGVVQNYTFVGSPNDGDLTTTIGGYQSYLLGNPYPSALSVKRFIEDNMEVLDGTLYFWEHVDVENKEGEKGHHYSGYVGGYGTRNIAMGLSANKVASNDNENDNTPSLGDGEYKEPKEYIAVGQGFFVSSDVDGGEITFNNSQREFKKIGDESEFFKVSSKTKKAYSSTTNTTLPIIKLGMDYVDEDGVLMHRQIGISFKENHSFGYDNGYDSVIFDLHPTDVYWSFPGSEQKYIIAGVQEITEDLEVPLNINVSQTGALNFTIDEWQAIAQDVYIKDLLTNERYKINNAKATIFLEEGNYENRFVLAFSSNSLGDDILPVENSIRIYYSNDNIVIENPYNKQINKAVLYSTTGKNSENWNLHSSDDKIALNLQQRISGIYIVNLIVDGEKVSKKIWIP